MPTSSSNAASTSTNEILGNQPDGGDQSKVDTKSLTRRKTMASAFEESQLIGRENEKSELVTLICNQSTQDILVISVWGMGGLGKTTLVKYIYQSQELNGMFEKRACVTIMRPFNPYELLSSLATQLGANKEEANGDRLTGLLEGKKYLIILDDISSTTE